MTSDFTKVYKQVMKELKISNLHAIPRLDRVVVNIGVGKQRDNKAFIEEVQRDLALITGQKPQERRARKAVAGFKVREGNLVGYRVTLRGKRMNEFVERLVNITLPRVRDFRGLSEKSLDGKGNLSIGFKEQLAFPEIRPEQTDAVFGVEVTIVTTADNNQEGLVLLKALGFPLVAADQMEEL
jgi:large subunit ribosomal protein L5